MKPVAIVNDSTGEIMYVLQGYDQIFEGKYEVVRIEIDNKRTWDFGQNFFVSVWHGDFFHEFTTEKYSIIYGSDDQ